MLPLDGLLKERGVVVVLGVLNRVIDGVEEVDYKQDEGKWWISVCRL